MLNISTIFDLLNILTFSERRIKIPPTFQNKKSHLYIQAFTYSLDMLYISILSKKVNNFLIYTISTCTNKNLLNCHKFPCTPCSIYIKTYLHSHLRSIKDHLMKKKPYANLHLLIFIHIYDRLKII